MIAFDVVWLLYASPAVALVLLALAWWARRSRVRRAVRWSEQLERVASSSGGRSAVALALAGFLASIALAGPRFGGRTVTTETKSLDLVIAADVSRSMLAEDVEPSRLERVQREASRLIQDLQGDRIGLIAFAGGSWILSPLTVDAGALLLLVDGLHPDIASTGGTSFAPAVRQARQLLVSGEDVADRVLVLFSDGEELDSLPSVLFELEALTRNGVHTIFVAQGGLEGVTIPIRDPDGVLIGYQRDPDNNIVRTRRRDDILGAMADAARATVVSGEVADQAATVRELVLALKRVPHATTTAQQDIIRAWIPLTLAVLILFAHTMTRRTAALAMWAMLLLGPSMARARQLPNPADNAWRDGDFRTSAELYLRQLQRGEGGDTAWLNVGTAALALGDSALAREALTTAARSLEPEIRFRALYNLGLLHLRGAELDTAGRREQLEAARSAYRHALLLRPHDLDAKWNLELAVQRLPPPPSGGASPPPPRSGGGAEQTPPEQRPGLTREQAEQLLNSMLEEERATRDAMNRRRSRTHRSIRRKDW